MAVIWAVVLAIMLGVVAYLISNGVWPVRGFGQFSAAGSGPATFVGVSVGIALGGLLGALQGLYKMKKQENIPNRAGVKPSIS